VSDLCDTERLVADWLMSDTTSGAPTDVVESAIDITGRRRPRPTWLAKLRTPPMTVAQHTLVGSPSARFAYLAVVSILVAALALGGAALGARLVLDTDVPSVHNGLIAFDAEGDIWLADPDGSDVRRLTNGPETEHGPIWSPDGTRLAYLVNDERGTSDLVHSDAAGGDRIVVASGLQEPSVLPQAWSPDGTRLVYSSPGDDGTPRVFVAQADGSGTIQVGDPTLMAKDPAWSPDGRSITFQGGSATEAPVDPSDPPKRGIYVMDADGSDPRLVSQVVGKGEYAFSMPLWSPDSTRIVTYAGPYSGFDIWVFEADGGGEVRVSDSVGDHYWATWSPDGTRIAFDQQAQGVRIAIADADGSEVRVLDEPLIDRWEPVWSPDGTRVVVHLGPDMAGENLGIVDPDGDAEMVVIPAARPGAVSWQRGEPVS